jgi:hypothetical protein
VVLHNVAPAVTVKLVRASALKSRTLPSSKETVRDSAELVGSDMGGSAAGSVAEVMTAGSAARSVMATGAGRASTSLPVPTPSGREHTSQEAAKNAPHCETAPLPETLAFTVTSDAPAASVESAKGSGAAVAAAPPDGMASDSAARSLTSTVLPSLNCAYVTTRAVTPSQSSRWTALHLSDVTEPGSNPGGVPTNSTPVVARASRAIRHAGVSVTKTAAGDAAGTSLARPREAVPGEMPRATAPKTSATLLSLLVKAARPVMSAPVMVSPGALPPLDQSAQACRRVAW